MRIRRGGPGWAVILGAAALAATTVALTRLWLPAAFATGAAALVTIVAGIWTSRGAKTLTERDRYRRGLAGLMVLGRHGRLPRVRDLHDAVTLGVHPASGARLPEFITRDITARLCEQLGRGRFVLIVGESTAGKSRAAYEAVRARCPDHQLIQPAGKEALAAATQAAREHSRAVLWLDDLERFLGADGLSGAAVGNVLAEPGGDRLIVATMRAEEYAKYSGRTGGIDGPSRDAVRRGWEVLRLATRLTLPRTWSPDELERAARHCEDTSIREALKHSDRFGVAEYLAAGPQLLADLQDAWAPGTHPRAAALVTAATDARRVGIHRPLPRAVLNDLHRHYLDRRGGRLLRPESPEEAILWATTPLHATSSLLLPHDNETYLAFDYLIDAVAKDPVAPEVLITLLNGATAEEAMEIGELAWSWHSLIVAEKAFQDAQDAGHIPGVVRRCHLIRERDGSAAGLRFACRELRRHAERDPDGLEALKLADLVAWETAHNGDSGAALLQLERLYLRAAEVLGNNHETTLNVKFGVAYWTGMRGNHRAAAGLMSRVAEDCARSLGSTHRMTVSARQATSREIGHAGDWDLAIRTMRELVRDLETRQQHPDDLRSVRSQLAYLLTQAEDHAGALPLWRELLEESNTIHGRLSLYTLSYRTELADCIGHCGDPAEAVRLLTDTAADAARLEDPPSTNVLGIGRSLAMWIGEAGDPAEAVRKFDDLVATAIRCRGTDDGWTLGLRRRRAHWVGESGDAAAAVRELEQLTVDAAGDDWMLRHVRESLAHWRERTGS
ncbi:hypothetical protein ACIA5G_14405 [Amycolatopsis sp. NPDC051758]|uniref:hypothetical protein n=1 Tax=Amycolatopsis sp. NPDC051758 TaxID=3363935 RepID=UPI003791501B